MVEQVCSNNNNNSKNEPQNKTQMGCSILG